MKNITKIAYQFARKIVKAIPDIELINNKNKMENINLKEIEDQIIPFTSKQSQKLSIFQQSVKDDIVKTLKNTETANSIPSLDQQYQSNKLVNRPNKGVVWGLGGQLMVADRKIHLQGVKDSLDEIIEFLELHQVKGIYVHDFHKIDTNNNRRRYSLIGSCFSAKHCWKTGLQLKNAFNLNSSQKFHKRKSKYDPIVAIMNGNKNQDWILVQYKDYEISLMTEEQRQAVDLEWKWNNPVSEETLDKYTKAKMHKGRKNYYENL